MGWGRDRLGLLRDVQATGFHPHSCPGTTPAPHHDLGFWKECAYLGANKDGKPVCLVTAREDDVAEGHVSHCHDV